MLPAYAGLISSVGLGFLMQTTYLLPLTIFSLVLPLGALGYRAKRRRGYGPLVLGIGAAAGLLLGKFIADSNVVVGGSIALLIGAALWNAWPTNPKSSVSSAPEETRYQLGSMKGDKI